MKGDRAETRAASPVGGEQTLFCRSHAPATGLWSHPAVAAQSKADQMAVAEGAERPIRTLAPWNPPNHARAPALSSRVLSTVPLLFYTGRLARWWRETYSHSHWRLDFTHSEPRLALVASVLGPLHPESSSPLIPRSTSSSSSRPRLLLLPMTREMGL